MVECCQIQRGTHTEKATAIDTCRKKLTLVIWPPKLEGFALNTSAENIVSQRRKESKNVTRVEERKKIQKARLRAQAAAGV